MTKNKDLGFEPVLGKNAPLVPISNSEIGTFKDCRRKWYLSYYLGLQSKNEKVTGALAFGTRIHKCLEEFYKNGVHPVDTHRELISQVRQSLPEDSFEFDDLDKDEDLGQIMLEGYIEWLEETGADSDLEIVGAEKKLTLPLMDGRVELRGKVDLRARNLLDGSTKIIDFKTVANRDTYVKIAHIAEQLKMYIMLENSAEDTMRVDGGRYRLLKKVKRSKTAKPPFYEDFEIRHNRETLDNFWFALHGVLGELLDVRAQLDSGQDHHYIAYPTPSNDCTWKCPFYAACPMMDDGSAADEYLHDNYEQNDPYQRYEEESETE